MTKVKLISTSSFVPKVYNYLYIVLYTWSIWTLDSNFNQIYNYIPVRTQKAQHGIASFFNIASLIAENIHLLQSND